MLAAENVLRADRIRLLRFHMARQALDHLTMVSVQLRPIYSGPIPMSGHDAVRGRV